MRRSAVSGRWLAGKAAAALVTFAFVLVFNFFLFRVMGDPTTQLARLPQATPQEIQQLRHDYGLDKPLLGQFTDYVGDTAHLDLGLSQRSRQPVWDEIKDALPWTLLLVGTGTLLATVIGAWMGVVAATRRGKRTDDGLLGFSLFTYAAPEYWIGIILILVFAVWIPIFPTGLQVTPGVEFSSFFANAWRRGQAPGAAGHGDDPDAAGPVLPDHALVDGRRADRGLHHRQAGDRPALGAGGPPPRGAERAAAAGDAVGDPVRRGRRRRDHDRDDLLLAGPGRAQLRGDQRQGLPGARRGPSWSSPPG